MTKHSTFRTNGHLKQEMERAMARDGVNQRGRSRWLCAQIHILMAADPMLETVGAGEGLEEYDSMQRITMDPATVEAVDKAYRIVRTLDPRAEGVLGALLRASIRFATTGHQGVSSASQRRTLRRSKTQSSPAAVGRTQ